MRWDIRHFHNRWLPVGKRRADVVVSVRAQTEELGGDGADHCIGFLLDKSGSMDKADDPLGRGLSRMAVAKEAMLVALSTLRPGTVFFVVAYDARPQVVMPPQVFESVETINGMQRFRELEHGGSTKFSRVIERAASLFSAYPNHVRHALFLTDGRNDPEDDRETKEGQGLIALLAGLDDSIAFSARGIGLDWDPAALRRIAEATMGDVAALPIDPSGITEDFRRIVGAAQTRSVRDVRLRLSVPRTSRLVSATQTSPTNMDLLGRTRSEGRVSDIPLGSWGAETRDYLLSFEFDPLPSGERMMVCRPSLEVNGQTVAGTAPVAVEWTRDGHLSARIDTAVAHYRGEAEKSREIDAGLAALTAGDEVAATERLGRAVQLARSSEDSEMLERLAGVVEVVDAELGTIRLRRGASKAAVMDLDVSSTRTVRARLPYGARAA